MSEAKTKEVRIVIGHTSDIGQTVAESWVNDGHTVLGTYRSAHPYDQSERGGGVRNAGLQMDLTDSDSIELTTKNLCDQTKESGWDALLVATGTMEPIGHFPDINFPSIRSAFDVNFMGPLQIIHGILPNANCGARVIVFSGAGTNGTADNYFSYALSKIANIKMCELLDSEIKEVCFTALGPGWVKTKIHEETLKAGANSGENLLVTENKLRDADMYSVKDVVRAVKWLLDQESKLIGGRNFSSAHDPLLSPRMAAELLNDSDMFKLRRHKNKLGGDVAESEKEYLYSKEAFD